MNRRKSDNKKISNEKRIHTPFTILPDGRFAEQAFDDKKVFFIVYNRLNLEKPFSKADSVQGMNGETYYPIDNNEVRKSIVYLPSDIVENPGTIEELFIAIKNLLDGVHESPNELERNIDVLYILLTYFSDLLPIVPYRRIMGKYGTGKSRWLKAMVQLCHRGIKVSGCSTDKALVRLLDKWKNPTAIIDEADFGKSDLYSFITKILNVGHDRNLSFYHRCEENSTTETKSYDVFGPKLLATRKSYWDTALESRCITFYGHESERNLPLYLPPKFELKAQELRNRLNCFRLMNYSKFREKIKELYDPEKAKELFGEYKISKRIQQVLFPLQLIGDDTIKEMLCGIARKMHERIMVQDEEAELEVLIKEVILDLYEDVLKDGTKELGELTTGRPHVELEIGEISISILTRQGLKEIKPNQKQGMSRKVIQICRTRLGIEPKIAKNKARIISLDGSENFLRKDEQVPIGSSVSSLVPEENPNEEGEKEAVEKLVITPEQQKHIDSLKQPQKGVKKTKNN